MPPLHPATLTFTQEGRPLQEANVRLVSPDVGWVVGGLTDANGRVELFTHGRFRGAPVGEYSICVDKYVTEGELPSPQNPYAVWTVFNVIEQQYWYAHTTPLTVTIVEGRNTPPPFDVGSEVRIEPPPSL